MEKVNVPEGISGDWEIEKFEIKESDRMFSLFSYGYRAPSPGIYTRLTHRSTVIMSDTPAEMRDHFAPVYRAKGHILINGLGLGMVLQNSMEKEEVTKATVIEISQDVIDLVGPHYKKMYGDDLEIIHADALTFKPPKNIKYGMVWHDIWPSICGDNYEEMKTLHRRYGRKCEWQGSWCREEVKRCA